MQQNVVVNAQCTDRKAIVSELSKIAASTGCNIINCRMSVLGKEFGAMMMLSGSWSAIARMETALNQLEKKLGLKTIIKRTEHRTHEEYMLPYSVQIVALDTPGVIHKITEFFDSLNVIVDDLHCDTYTTSNTATRMLSLNITIHIPATCHIATVRERFLVFCDDNNLDAAIEPVKS